MTWSEGTDAFPAAHIPSPLLAASAQQRSNFPWLLLSEAAPFGPLWHREPCQCPWCARGFQAPRQWDRGECVPLYMQDPIITHTLQTCAEHTKLPSHGQGTVRRTLAKAASWQRVIYILASFHYPNESFISRCNINSRKSAHYIRGDFIKMTIIYAATRAWRGHGSCYLVIPVSS